MTPINCCTILANKLTPRLHIGNKSCENVSSAAFDDYFQTFRQLHLFIAVNKFKGFFCLNDK